jgi:uncharacterized protein
MPEYLAPGVYVEETSFRSKSIEGVSTTTTGFIGPARYGPLNLTPDIVTSLGEFERMYGDRQQLQFYSVAARKSPSDPLQPKADDVMHNYLWHAVRAFFEEGGRRLYISRIFRPLDTDPAAKPDSTVDVSGQNLYVDGCARGRVPSTAGANSLVVRARFPGATGSELRVVFTVRLGSNVLGRAPVRDSQGKLTGNFAAQVSSLLDKDVVWIVRQSSPPASPTTTAGDYYVAESILDSTTQDWTWQFRAASTSPPMLFNTSPPSSGLLGLQDLILDNGTKDFQVRIVTLTVTVILPDESTLVWNGLPLDPRHLAADGMPDSVFAYFSENAGSLSQALRLPIVVASAKKPDGSDQLDDGLDVLEALFTENQDLRTNLDNLQTTDLQRSVPLALSGGNDGQRPTASEYEGTDDETKQSKTGLKIFEDIEDISILAAPGVTYGFEKEPYKAQAETIISLLIAHAQQMRYRIAVLDSGDGQAIADVRQMRARLDSTYGALYYPWIRILDPVTQQEIVVPPSGAVAGIYARNDIQRAVYKAPANEVVNSAIGFELLLNKSQQDVLNPEGINCFRFFEGRGLRLWGARTISSDPEWKYVNLRRYFIYLERSIDRGTQWAVFEPNGEHLWANVRRTISDFLLNEWQMGALLGDKPEKAYFVKCDRTTMTQNDLDNGRLVCLIGVAPLYPAEFVIFRIGQWTADAKV